MLDPRPRKNVTGTIVTATTDKPQNTEIIKTSEKGDFEGETPEILENSDKNQTIVRVYDPMAKKLKKKKIQLVYNKKPSSDNSSLS